MTDLRELGICYDDCNNRFRDLRMRQASEPNNNKTAMQDMHADNNSHNNHSQCPCMKMQSHIIQLLILLTIFDTVAILLLLLRR